MIVSREEQDKKALDIWNTNLDKSENVKGIEIMQEYAKWYAEKVIDRYAEVVSMKEIIKDVGTDEPFIYSIVDKQSILKVKEEL